MLVYEPTELFAEKSITWSWLLVASSVGLSPSCGNTACSDVKASKCRATSAVTFTQELSLRMVIPSRNTWRKY